MAHVCSRCKTPHVCHAGCNGYHRCRKCGHRGGQPWWKDPVEMQRPSEAERAGNLQQLRELIEALARRL